MITRQTTALVAVFSLAIAILIWEPWNMGAQAQDGEGDQALWRRSDVSPRDTPRHLLIPPASTPAPGASDADAPVLGPDGVVLRDFRLPGSALRPRSSDVGYYWARGGGCLYNDGGDPAEIFNVALTLPQGAIINTVRMYYYDESPLDAVGWFTVYDLYGALVAEWEMASSGVGGNGFADTLLPIEHTVDYSQYSYALNWRPMQEGSTMQLCGFRIFYEPPPFGLGFLPWVAAN